jgi:CheY-like chemotaxis protein
MQLEEATHTHGALFLVREGDEPWSLEWARGSSTLLGKDEDGLTSEPTAWWSAVLGEDREGLRADLVSSWTDRVVEYRTSPSVAGARRWIRESLRRVRLPDGRTVLVSVARDVTLEREAERSDASPVGGATHEIGAGAGPLVLLVEDDEAVRSVLSRVLTREGFTTLLAGSVTEALRVFERAPREIELLVSDVVLPDRPVAELARALRRRRPDLPVLLMSGYGTEELERRGDLLQGLPLLPKPFTPSELVRSMRACLASVEQKGGGGALSSPQSVAS